MMEILTAICTGVTAFILVLKYGKSVVRGIREMWDDPKVWI